MKTEIFDRYRYLQGQHWTMSPIRKSLLPIALHFQTRNLPIWNLHPRRKKCLQSVRYFRASLGRICGEIFYRM